MNESEKTRQAFEKFAEKNGIEFQNGENEFSYFDLQTAFEAGAEFAQRWISAEKELPEPGTMCIVKNESGRIRVGKCLETFNGERNFYDLYNVYSKLLIENVSHWRPIELK